MDFSFGTRSYDEEMAKLSDMLDRAETQEETSWVNAQIEKAMDNKKRYEKIDKDELRRRIYVDGIDIHYTDVHKRSGLIDDYTIHYKMLYRTTSKAKVGQCVFINADLYDEAIEWMTMGLHSKMPEAEAKIVEMSAYAPLTTSTLVGRLYCPVDDVFIVKDVSSFVSTNAEIVEAEDYETTVKIVNDEATEANRKEAIKNGTYKADGSLKFKTVYDNASIIKKKCVVHSGITEIENVLWDGMALIDTSIIPESYNGMVLLRNHFFKACAFRTKIKDFFKDWCAEHGYDYEHYQVQDMFGRWHFVKDIKIITTDNAIKWKKFFDLMGNDMSEAYSYWRERIEADDCIWGIVKTDHESKLGDNQQMSYQMINTLPCDRWDISDIAMPAVEYVESIKKDPDKFNEFLKKNGNITNHYDMMSALYEHNPLIADSKWFRQEKSRIIQNYVGKLKKGKIFVSGDNLTMCGNPLALLYYVAGGELYDPSLSPRKSTIECYTTRFEDGSEICAFRNPHNSPNNICHFTNVRHPMMDRYFEFSDNIIAVNCIHTEVQSRLNGADFDSDFVFCTDQPVMVDKAYECYRDYPTIVNKLKESGITYNNTLIDYAEMDNNLAKSQRVIGESSNLAQLAMSYYWTDRAHYDEITDETEELYDTFVILSVLAQVAIDSSKREYEVSAGEEVDRLKKLPSMTRTVNGKKKDLPKFMKYTKAVQVQKNGKLLPGEVISQNKNKINNRIDESIICPMNYLVDILNQIQGARRTNTIPTKEFFVKHPGKADARQVSKIYRIVHDYSSFVLANLHLVGTDHGYEVLAQETEDVIEKIKKVKIGNLATMSRMIETALAIDTYVGGRHHQDIKRYSLKVLNLLYRSNPQKFLKCFISEDDYGKELSHGDQ